MTSEEKLELSDKELEAVKRYAELKGVGVDEAASELISLGLEKRMRKGSKRSPANNIKTFRR